MFKKEREAMDYTWFPRYDSARHAVQDRIILATIAGHRRRAQQTAIYTSGTYGSGKTHAMRGELAATFSRGLVRIDPDEIRRQLPEWAALVETKTAGAMTHKEATFIALMTERVCLAMGLSYLVDGSLGDAAWYTAWLQKVESCGYNILLVRFECSIDLAHKRCEKRAKDTGRHIRRDEIARSHDRSSEAWPLLLPHAYMWWCYNTDDALALLRHGGNF